MNKTDKIYWLSLFDELSQHSHINNADEMTTSALTCAYVMFCKANGFDFLLPPEHHINSLMSKNTHPYIVRVGIDRMTFDDLAEALDICYLVGGELVICDTSSSSKQ